MYKLIDSKELKTEKIINKEYDPNYHIPKKPRYCKDRICQVCFFKNCPHLGVGEVPEDDYKKIMKCIGKIYGWDIIYTIWK